MASFGCTFPLLLLLASMLLHVTSALEFMDESVGYDEAAHLAHNFNDDDSAELPATLNGYTRDTIMHFNPKKSDANFRQLWERVPSQKVDVIKRR
ncbi:uncharacterized protein LOC115629381 [Scaptodrosophila lebanonensis]|uniref:Uncharacterized protein LOC115629381 n=1 Tax=Drosophila lebanonensis TaxID=7225 RepID=A0A6J2U1B9_DROLE|nr:uncharacterized protein LOC115629381 [Scaptodrosophila lebanonensis]